MKLFGYRILIMREEEFQSVADAMSVRLKIVQLYGWFKGWRDLSVLFDYVLGLPLEQSWGNIEEVRKEYAKQRGTDEHGNEI